MGEEPLVALHRHAWLAARLCDKEVSSISMDISGDEANYGGGIFLDETGALQAVMAGTLAETSYMPICENTAHFWGTSKSKPAMAGFSKQNLDERSSPHEYILDGQMIVPKRFHHITTGRFANFNGNCQWLSHGSACG